MSEGCGDPGRACARGLGFFLEGELLVLDFLSLFLPWEEEEEEELFFSLGFTEGVESRKGENPGKESPEMEEVKEAARNVVD